MPGPANELGAAESAQEGATGQENPGKAFHVFSEKIAWQQARPTLLRGATRIARVAANTIVQVLLNHGLGSGLPIDDG